MSAMSVSARSVTSERMSNHPSYDICTALTPYSTTNGRIKDASSRCGVRIVWYTGYLIAIDSVVSVAEPAAANGLRPRPLLDGRGQPGDAVDDELREDEQPRVDVDLENEITGGHPPARRR
jgi:hypothetical protein